MPRVKNKSKPLESNILSENVSQQKLDDGKAREINQKVILKQLKEFRKKGLITEKEFNNRKKQIFGSNKK